MITLSEALAANRAAVATALPDAEQELAECQAHCRALESQIQLAQRLLAGDLVGQQPSHRTPLHEVMKGLLASVPLGLSAPEIARQVDERGLYRRRDGGAPGVGQIHARVNNYPELFIRDAGRIRLRVASDPRP